MMLRASLNGITSHFDLRWEGRVFLGKIALHWFFKNDIGNRIVSGWSVSGMVLSLVGHDERFPGRWQNARYLPATTFGVKIYD